MHFDRDLCPRCGGYEIRLRFWRPTADPEPRWEGTCRECRIMWLESPTGMPIIRPINDEPTGDVKQLEARH